jgi:hypothetical protein
MIQKAVTKVTAFCNEGDRPPSLKKAWATFIAHTQKQPLKSIN